MSLAEAFDQRCERLSMGVGRSCDSLAEIHANRVTRDLQMIRGLNGSATVTRAAVESLSKDLQPRLDRLASTEPQHARPPASVAWSFGSAPTKKEVLAASRLQAAWKRTHPYGSGGHPRFCPELLRRNFVLGIRTLSVRPEDGLKAAAAPAVALPPLELPVVAAPLVPPRPPGASGLDGPSHFMSIL